MFTKTESGLTFSPGPQCVPFLPSTATCGISPCSYRVSVLHVYLQFAGALALVQEILMLLPHNDVARGKSTAMVRLSLRILNMLIKVGVAQPWYTENQWLACNSATGSNSKCFYSFLLWTLEPFNSSGHLLCTCKNGECMGLLFELPIFQKYVYLNCCDSD